MKLDYICTSKYHPNDEFTLFSRIQNQRGEKITADRYMKFGKVHCGEITMSKDAFRKYYRKCETDEILEV